MKNLIFTRFLGAVALSTGLLASSQSVQAQFKFDPTDAKELANFMKKPSALSGKTNAEALGINIHAADFSWDDLNTWKNEAGENYTENPDNGIINTFWGTQWHPKAPWNGKCFKISWSTKYAEADSPKTGLENLAGSLTMSDFYGTNVTIGFTQIDTMRLAMKYGTGTWDPNNPSIEKWSDCYIKVVDNTKLKQLDLSNSTGHLRQVDCYRNALQGDEGLKMENICTEYFMGGPDKDKKLFYFLGWSSNAEKNKFTFSTIPHNPNTGLPWLGYKAQYDMEIGEPDGNGGYYITPDDGVNLSGEYQPKKSVTQYVWKDLDGNDVKPSRERNGFFLFGEEHIGKTIICQMSNADYPALVLFTVPVTIKSASGVTSTVMDKITLSPNPMRDIVELSGNEMVEKVQFYTFTGSCVLNIDFPNSRLDVTDLAAGAYIARITTAYGDKVIKVIKK